MGKGKGGEEQKTSDQVLARAINKLYVDFATLDANITEFNVVMKKVKGREDDPVFIALRIIVDQIRDELNTTDGHIPQKETVDNLLNVVCMIQDYLKSCYAFKDDKTTEAVNFLVAASKAKDYFPNEAAGFMVAGIAAIVLGAALCALPGAGQIIGGLLIAAGVGLAAKGAKIWRDHENKAVPKFEKSMDNKVATAEKLPHDLKVDYEQQTKAHRPPDAGAQATTTT